MPFEYGGQTWPDLPPTVTRTREIRLLHPTPDDVDAYQCRWPNGEVLTAFREGRVIVPRQGATPSTMVMVKDANGIHTGTLRMILLPGQDPAGEVRCKAGRFDYPEGQGPELFYDLTAYRMWKAANPTLGEPTRTITWSEWSNPQPLGVVEPDPVPEPAFILLLGIGLLGLCFAAWRRKTQ